MSSTFTKFSDAIYHKVDNFNFGATVFSRRMLKILLLIDGNKTVSEISEELTAPIHLLMPEFAKLVQIGLIQTEGGIVSSGTSDLIYSDEQEAPTEYTLSRMPTAIAA